MPHLQPMLYWALIVLLTLPVFVLICRMLFSDLDSFVEAIVLFFTSSGVAALNGEAGDAFSAKLKILFAFAAWAALIAGVHHLAGEAFARFL